MEHLPYQIKILLITLQPNLVFINKEFYRIYKLYICNKSAFISIDYQIRPSNRLLKQVCRRGVYVETTKKFEGDWRAGFISACKGGHIDIIQIMMDKGVTCINTGYKLACRYGHLKAAQFLVYASGFKKRGYHKL